MAVLAASSFALGALLITGRLGLDATDTQERMLRVIANASVVGGAAGALVGGRLLVAPLLG
jgi:hypothetical protein